MALARQAKDGDTVFFGEPTARKVIRVRLRPATPRTVLPAGNPAGKKVLGLDDFRYAGSFRLAERVGKSGAGYWKSASPWEHARWNQASADEVHFSATDAFEVEVPSFARFDGTDSKPLRVAEVKKVWGSLVLDIPEW